MAATPPDGTGEQRIPILTEGDIVVARQRAREIATELGFKIVDQSRIATAVSELARNVVRYAIDGRGEALIRSISNSDAGLGIEIVVSDSGPGIPDIQLALRDGFSSGTGLGLGLPGAKRLVDELEIESSAGKGTVVTIRKWRR